jgi:malonyl-ACP decarboxylase
MKTSSPAITGLGVVSAIGQGKQGFFSSLLSGQHAFGYLQRAGRRSERPALGAEISELRSPGHVPLKSWRAASWSARAALVCLDEAWNEAGLAEVDPRRIGLIVGGSNFQQREHAELRQALDGRRDFVRPSYALSFMDSDVCGFCTEHFGIRGFAFTLGGASASGQLAVIQAANALSSGQVDVCIALGALMDLSAWECNAFRALGAMGSERFADEPARACRPFDAARDGFIFGEASAAIVLENLEKTGRRAHSYGRLAGWGVGTDGNRGSEPSLEGERHVIATALKMARCAPEAIDYVNPHGSGSVLGDQVELEALASSGLTGAAINTTKSITGHGLCAAGAVEIVAVLLQLEKQVLHPCRNLEQPVDARFAWTSSAQPRAMKSALSLSMGFGGLSTAVCIQRE